MAKVPCAPFEQRCDLFGENGTQIGSHIPASVVTDEDDEGSAYPMNHAVSGTHLGFAGWSSRRKNSRALFAFVVVRVRPRFRRAAAVRRSMRVKWRPAEIVRDRDDVADTDEWIGGGSGTTDGERLIRGTTSLAGTGDIGQLAS